ncbi:MAG TPA: hypothetical protein VH482_08670 [Thermomicrobiales bacterium]|jgi:hypothetical protein
MGATTYPACQWQQEGIGIDGIVRFAPKCRLDGIHDFGRELLATPRIGIMFAHPRGSPLSGWRPTARGGGATVGRQALLFPGEPLSGSA